MNDPIEAQTAEEDLETKYKRALAEVENLRKRKQRDVDLAVDAAEKRVTILFLEVIDDFQRVLDAVQTYKGKNAKQQIADGVNLVFKKFMATLEQLEVQGFESKGQQFAAELMEAIAQVPSRTLPSGTVEAEVSQGFTRRGKLLRPARVVVAVSAPPEEGSGGSAE